MTCGVAALSVDSQYNDPIALISVSHVRAAPVVGERGHRYFGGDGGSLGTGFDLLLRAKHLFVAATGNKPKLLLRAKILRPIASHEGFGD